MKVLSNYMQSLKSPISTYGLSVFSRYKLFWLFQEAAVLSAVCPRDAFVQWYNDMCYTTQFYTTEHELFISQRKTSIT